MKHAKPNKFKGLQPIIIFLLVFIICYLIFKPGQTPVKETVTLNSTQVTSQSSETSSSETSSSTKEKTSSTFEDVEVKAKTIIKSNNEKWAEDEAKANTQAEVFDVPSLHLTESDILRWINTLLLITDDSISSVNGKDKDCVYYRLSTGSEFYDHTYYMIDSDGNLRHSSTLNGYYDIMCTADDYTNIYINRK